MSNPEITIRAVEPEDWPDIADIFDQPRAIAGTLQMPFRSKAWQKQRLAERAPGGIHLGAVLGGKLVGTISMRQLEGRRSHVASFGMGVHDAYQGRGVGSALLAAALDFADRWWGALRIELTVFADNARAIGLYEKHGFVREGRHVAYAIRDGVLIDALAMARVRAG